MFDLHIRASIFGRNGDTTSCCHIRTRSKLTYPPVIWSVVALPSSAQTAKHKEISSSHLMPWTLYLIAFARHLSSCSQYFSCLCCRMKVLLLTLALLGCALSMPVGVEQDQPRSVVPLVITDYSSVASKNAEDAPAEIPKEPAMKEEEQKPEEKPVASEEKQETAAAPAADETPIEKAPAPPVDNQEAVSNDPKPTEVLLDQAPAEPETVQEKEEPAKTSEAEGSSSQDAPLVTPTEEKVADEINPPAPVALNVPKTGEKAEDISFSEAKPAEVAKEEQQADEKKVKAEEIKPVETDSAAAVINDPVEEKPLEKAEAPAVEKAEAPAVQNADAPAVENAEAPAVENAAKEPQKVEEPTKDEVQESTITSRRKRATDGKEDEKKKPTEVTKKEKDDKKAKAEDAPLISIDAKPEEVEVAEAEVPKIEEPKPEEAASEVKPVEIPKPIEDVPETKPNVPAEAESVPSAVPEIISDSAGKPDQVQGNINAEVGQEKKIELPKPEEEKVEKVQESTQQETKIVSEAVLKEAGIKPDEVVPVDEKKSEEATVVEEKKQVSGDEISSDPLVDKQEEKAPATTSIETVEKIQEPVADEKLSEEKEGGAKVAEAVSS